MEAKEYVGLWWLPTKPDVKVAGILYYRPSEEIRLDLIGSFNQDELSPFESVWNITMENIIHGKDSEGTDISLFECSCRATCKGKAEFASFTYNARSVAIGMHLNSIEEKHFFKAVVKIPELSYWLYPSTIHTIAPDDNTDSSLFLKLDKMATDGVTNIGQLTISLCRSVGYNSGNMWLNPALEQYTSVTIESKQKVSLKTLYKHVVRYEAFLSLATLHYVAYSDLKMYSCEYCRSLQDGTQHPLPVYVDAIFHDKPTVGIINQNDFLFDYKQIETKYPQVLEQWFAKDWKFDAIRGHFLESLSSKKTFSYIDFLVVVQAVEGYGRRYLKDKVKKYKQTISTEKKSIRLTEILSTILMEYKSVDRINQQLDIHAIAQIRHYHSHLLSKRNQTATNAELTYKLTNELRILLVCCIMTYIGFSVDEINQLTNDTHNGLFLDSNK